MTFAEFELDREHFSLVTEYADDLAPILGVPAYVQQVFINLLVNASQAFHGKPGKITVRTEVLDEHFIQATVADDGPGIAQENLKQIFEPFFSTKVHRGTGLGLSIVRRIMEGIGGAVSVESAEGRGAKFLVRFAKAPTRVP